MSRSEQLESERVGPVDATMTQTLSRIMKMDDEEFTEKYVTMKAMTRYGVISSAVLIVQKETDDGEFYVQFPVDVDQFVALVLNGVCIAVLHRHRTQLAVALRRD